MTSTWDSTYVPVGFVRDALTRIISIFVSSAFSCLILPIVNALYICIDIHWVAWQDIGLVVLLATRLYRSTWHVLCYHWCSYNSSLATFYRALLHHVIQHMLLIWTLLMHEFMTSMISVERSDVLMVLHMLPMYRPAAIHLRISASRHPLTIRASPHFALVCRPWAELSSWASLLLQYIDWVAVLLAN